MCKAQMVDTSGMKHSAGEIIQRYREELGLSRTQARTRMHLANGHLHRIESGSRMVSSEVLSRIAAGIGMDEFHYDQMMVAAGYAPPSLRRLGEWDPALSAVTKVLASERVNTEEKAEFRDAIRRLAQYYLGGRR